MRSSRTGDSAQFNSKIEQTFKIYRRQQLETHQKLKKEDMSEEYSNQIAIEANLEATQPNVDAVNENARFMGEYMVPLVVKSQSSIVNPTFGQTNFHLSTDVINMF